MEWLMSEKLHYHSHMTAKPGLTAGSEREEKNNSTLNQLPGQKQGLLTSIYLHAKCSRKEYKIVSTSVICIPIIWCNKFCQIMYSCATHFQDRRSISISNKQITPESAPRYGQFGGKFWQRNWNIFASYPVFRFNQLLEPESDKWKNFLASVWIWRINWEGRWWCPGWDVPP